MSEDNYSAADRALLERHVSSVDHNVYAIKNLPEEVVAVVFAYVSRSPLSFRDNLLRLLKDQSLNVAGLQTTPASGEQAYEGAQSRAREFHEKWVVNYGHASVAEHAVAHIGIEQVSRLASAELELSNPFLSFTEYSQRYQQPKRGDYHVPDCLEESGREELLQAYHHLQQQAYDCYLELLTALCRYHQDRTRQHKNEANSAYEARIRRRAFEDARYALTLATWTNLGMTGNARAIRDALVILYSDPYTETTRLAAAVQTAAASILPTLIRYAQQSDYLTGAYQSLQAWAEQVQTAVPEKNTFQRERQTGVSGQLRRLSDSLATGSEQTETIGRVRLVRWPAMELDLTEGDPVPAPFASASEFELHRELAARVLMQHGGLSLTTTAELSAQQPPARLARVVELALDHLGQHDMLLDLFKTLNYDVEFCISEANWHQLLRHSRKINFVYGRPSVEYGYTVPPHVDDAGLRPLLRELIESAAALWQRLRRQCPAAADYVVTNAHRRRLTATSSLWELYHLINLRLQADAQWDIRYTVEELYQQVAAVHPRLMARARPR